MADTRVASGLTVEQWDSKYFTEYLTENRYAGEMGTNENSIIQVKENLMKKPGDRINFALVNKLTQDAITGRAVLEGNEEDMASRSFELAVDKRRNAVRVAEIDEQYSAIALREAGRSVLKDWSLKDTERLVSKALGVMSDGTSNILMNATDIAASGNQTALDAWLSNNSDRVFFGNDAYAASSGDLSAGLATLTAGTAAENLTAANISKMKFIALNKANPKIRPIRVEANGRHYFVLYVHPLAFRDLKNDRAIFCGTA
jgi:N4-gp56 family major capsid protein